MGDSHPLTLSNVGDCYLKANFLCEKIQFISTTHRKFNYFNQKLPTNSFFVADNKLFTEFVEVPPNVEGLTGMSLV